MVRWRADVKASRQRTAQAAVEFALAVPVVLMLLLGVLDLGRGALAAASLTNAVREGARLGALHYPSSGWEATASARVRDSAFALEATQLTVVVSPVLQDGSSYVAVDGTYAFRLLAPFVAQLAPEIPLRATTRMLVR